MMWDIERIDFFGYELEEYLRALSGKTSDVVIKVEDINIQTNPNHPEK